MLRIDSKTQGIDHTVQMMEALTAIARHARIQEIQAIIQSTNEAVLDQQYRTCGDKRYTIRHLLG